MRTGQRIGCAALASTALLVGVWGATTGTARADDVTVTIGAGASATTLVCVPPSRAPSPSGGATSGSPSSPSGSTSAAASAAKPGASAAGVASKLLTGAPPEVAAGAEGVLGVASSLGAGDTLDKLAKHLPTKPGAELLVRFAYAFQDPQAPVRFAPAPGSGFATQPGGIYEGSEAPFRGGPISSIGVGYRMSGGVSVGLGGSFTQFVTSLTDGEGSSNLGRYALGIAPYVRAYARLGKAFELWASAGAGYATDVTTFNRMTAAGGTTAQGKWQLDYEGLSFPAGVGIDWQPFSWLFLGPSLGYVGHVAIRGCLDIDAPNLKKSWCSDDKVSVTRAFSYQVLSAGLSVRAAVF